MTTLRVWEYPPAFAALREALDAGEDVLDLLEALEESAAAKAVNIGLLVLEAKAEQATLAGEIDRLLARANVVHKTEARLKELAGTLLDTLGTPSVRDPRVKVARVGNGGQQRLVIDNMAELPPEHLRYNLLNLTLWQVPPSLWGAAVTAPNSPAIREALEADIEVPGAHLEPRGSHIDVR